MDRSDAEGSDAEGSHADGPRSPSAIARVELPVATRARTGTTNAYLVGGLLVDPAARTDELDAAVAERGTLPGERGGIEAIAVTHTHPDHVGAVADYAARTGATVHAHADHVDRFRDATGVDPDATFRDGDAIGTTGVRALDTPGHAPDHVAFAVENDATADREPEPPAEALVGDLAVAEGSVVVGAPEGDLREYLASLERVRDAGLDRLHPGHGPAIDDPVAACDRLIDHRLAREERVLAAVEAGADDVETVLEAAYDKDLTGVEDLARATVRAHLWKLASEGRIDGRWSDG
ncbi:Glyoxylase, beta-lactamase superfamily II [Halorubrum aquaticum]|uniref:Glyoxylase, beta-lactamase superfamily II n=1 Tax=Halorubrum aquaticum TaxID=387340 RepID=A0A1I3B536_9EURY|nr:MBL fold metallo-hydrolase [Halorubrum aquaticum]SFH57206.1 Glyoxylase, beta-lactamase superfamily II [Halorubrum aquaticum]